MKISAKDLAKLLKGTVVGDSEVEVSAPAKIEEGKQGTVTFLGNIKYEKYLYSTNASIVIVTKNFQPTKPINSTLIKVENVYQSVAFLMKTFETSTELERKVSKKAEVHSEARLSQHVAIGAFSQVNKGASVGEGSQIFSQVYIGENVTIGNNCVIHPGVKVYHNSVIGNNCIIHANAVIGSDGFGYSPNETGEYEKIPQIGNVLLEDNVEIGANTVIDKATMGSTIIKKGSKLDNLIQIAHNVQVGENSVIAAQTGIAGSTKIGDRVMIGGQVGIVGHIEIADDVKIQAQSGVTTTVKEPGFKLYGSPALEYRTYLKAYSIFRKLPDLVDRINKLESE